jgi:hypothetical protein
MFCPHVLPTWLAKEKGAPLSKRALIGNRKPQTANATILRRRIIMPMPPKPRNSIAQVAGSAGKGSDGHGRQECRAHR